MAEPSYKQAQSIVGTSPNRPLLDHYPTPPEATQALLDREKFNGVIWEPACGDGAMSKVLKANGYDVINTDIHDYGYEDFEGHLNFLEADKTMLCQNVVTNPPFKHALEFAEKALQLTTGKVAFLLKLQFLEGKKRKQFFIDSPLKTVYVFSSRVQMSRDGAPQKSNGMLAFAWYVWEHGYEGEPVIRWI